MYVCVLYVFVDFQIAAVVQNVDPNCGLAGELGFLRQHVTPWAVSKWRGKKGKTFLSFLFLAPSVVAGQFTKLTELY